MHLHYAQITLSNRACRLDWRSAPKILIFVFIQAGVVSLHSTMLPFMVTVHWLTFSLLMELTPTWSVMRDRQPFILVAGEQQFKVLIAWLACLFSLFGYVTVTSSSVSALHLVVLLIHIRQGNIYIMHQMMQHGADLRLIDLQGKNAMHHAVMGGSMWVAAQHKFDIHHVVVCQHHCKQVFNISRSPFPVLLCIICGRRECFGSQTQICTMWHHFTWRHPQETQMWSDICSETRYDVIHSLTCSHFLIGTRLIGNVAAIDTENYMHF